MDKNLRLKELFDLAKERKLVKNQREFSKLIGVENSNFTHALHNRTERVNLDNMIRKAEHALMKAGIAIGDNSGDGSMQNVSGSNNTIGVPAKNFIHEEEWFALVADLNKQIAEKDKQIARLLSIIEKIYEA